MKAMTSFELLLQENNKTSVLDRLSSTSLCSLLSSTCNLDKLGYVLAQNRVPLNADILVNCSESFVMSGKFEFYVSLVSKFLNHTPAPDCVSRIINATILARSRRLMSQTDVTEAEAMALETLFSRLDEYHANYPSSKDENEMSSIFAMKQLMWMERNDGEVATTEEEAYCLSLTPTCESQPFEFVVEDRDIPFELEIHDLTAQIAKKQPDKFLLKGGQIFSKALQKEQKLLKIGAFTTETETEDEETDELTDNIRQRSFK